MSAFVFDGLPNGLGQFFLTEFVGMDALTEAERNLLTNLSAQKRVKDLASGRHCARQALAQLGLADQQILRKNDREPLWPDGFVGSISHSAKMAGAVVCRKENFQSVGLDIETIGGVKPEMWRLLFTPNEQQFLTQQTEADKALYNTLIFSFKESFYKMQYPVLQTELDFLDVEIMITSEGVTMNNELFSNNRLQFYWARFNDQVISLILLNNL